MIDDCIIYSQCLDVIFGFNNIFNYKGFDLFVFLYVCLGQWIVYDYNIMYCINVLENGGNVDYWIFENFINVFLCFNKSKSYIQVIYYLMLKYEDGFFFKICDIMLGYIFKLEFLKYFNLFKFCVYVIVKNFFIFSKIDNYDFEQGGSIFFFMIK